MKMMNLFPFAPHLAFWVTHYAGTKFGVFMLSTGGGKTMGTEGNLRLVKKIAPDVLIGMPTFLYHLLHEAAAAGVRCPDLKKLVLGGEKVPTGIRSKLRELARELGAKQVDVLATYGFTEAKLAFPECPFPEGAQSAGYHLFPDLGIVEIVDPKTGEPVPNGSPGEIVFTTLDARGSVVLRYRTGDCVEGGLVHEPCPYCGRLCPRLVGRISRRSDIREMRIDKLKGTLLDFNKLEHVLDNVEHVGAWQLELRKAHDDPLDLDEIVLHIERRGRTGEAQLCDEINRRFAEATEVHPNRICFHTVEEMRAMQGVGSKLKEERIVDHRPKSEPSPVSEPMVQTST
jgi:phenylacetate-coenzyme A ligase PaaK-like adenylate-forming protein